MPANKGANMKRKTFLKGSLLFLGGITEISCIPKSMTPKTSPSSKNQTLGLNYSADASHFRIWAPNAQAVRLSMYTSPSAQTATKQVLLQQEEEGIWSASLQGDWNNHFYTFQIQKDVP